MKPKEKHEILASDFRLKNIETFRLEGYADAPYGTNGIAVHNITGEALQFGFLHQLEFPAGEWEEDVRKQCEITFARRYKYKTYLFERGKPE